MVPLGWHHTSYIQEAKRQLDAGMVGQIESVLCHMASPIRGLLQGLDFDHEANGGGLFPPDPTTWADPIIADGGYGHAQMSHSLSLMSWLTGLVPQDVFAMMTQAESKVEMYDALTVRFTNGVIGALSGSGDIPEGQMFQLDIRIFGSEGMLLLDIERARLAREEPEDALLFAKGEREAYISLRLQPDNRTVTSTVLVYDRGGR